MPDERGAPERIEVKSLADYLDVMSKAVFQSGMSWKVVDGKWATTRETFDGFDPEKVAAYGEPQLGALKEDTRVIRNRRKLAAVVNNAQTMIELEAEHGTFRGYLRSHESFDATVDDIRKQFSFMGDMGCYYFLYVVGEETPSHDQWVASRAAARAAKG
ncbi:MAG TPA: DNA-3-methyladenine glycosylase I [Dehalococcoidia bacterium]|nr:DNA-3-methyladenine glycosylase I [Dehalococcoidia bacterium]